MKPPNTRRQLLGMAGAISALSPFRSYASAKRVPLLAGEAAADISPSNGVELGGAYREPGQERLVTAVRKPGFARCLVIGHGNVRTAIVSLDLLAVSEASTARIQRAAAAATGIPASHVRVCATHTHTMPTLRPLTLYGRTSPEYVSQVEGKVVAALVRAKADLAPAELFVGQGRASNASYNRTDKVWKTDQQFDGDATDAERWIDTRLQLLRFARKGRPDLLWYNFAAHPVCERDSTEASPDWPGRVAELAAAEWGARASFLQGHCGDVNPGDGRTQLGESEAVALAVFGALRQALNSAEPCHVDRLVLRQQSFGLRLDLQRHRKQLADYHSDPAACVGKGWGKPAFSRAWFEHAKASPPPRALLSTKLTALRIGSVALLFHPGELYSYYGMAIRRDSALSHVLAVGYSDDLVGYLPDPRAFERLEYAAIVVPKILGLPPFEPTATRALTAASVRLLRSTTGG